MKPSALASAAGGLVGGAAVAVPAAAATGLTTTVTELGRGLGTVADEELNLPGKLMSAVGGMVNAPVAGVVHGLTTGAGTPFVSAVKAFKEKNLNGMGEALDPALTVPGYMNL